MNLIIGIGNKARQGKDIAASGVYDYYENQRQIVQRFYPNGNTVPIVKIYKFADHLYKECCEVYGMKEKDAPLLQKVGMERREQDLNYWVRKVEQEIEEDSPSIALISDMRFENEAFFVKSKGGFTVNVTRLNPDGSRYISSDRPSNHPSEVQLDDYHYDHYIKVHSGEAALLSEIMITITEHEYVRRK